MVTNKNGVEYLFIEQYINQLPWWRKILAQYFKKYKITKKEYLDWFYNKKMYEI